MKRVISSILRKKAGTKKMQKIYEALFRLALSGMNYGNGGNFEESGELNVLNIIKKKYAPQDFITIFDVGANVGNYSKKLSGYFKDKAIIHAFEPSKKTFDLFLQTTKGISNIFANNFGLSDVETDITLYTNEDGSGLASIYHRNLDHFGIAMDQSEIIQLSTIDTYCERNNIDRINFLKLDVEGHELSALKGARNMIDNKQIDYIQFEFGGCNIDSRTYFQDFFYLLKGKYRIHRILKDGLFEISNYKETNEIFITINYLAERID